MTTLPTAKTRPLQTLATGLLIAMATIVCAQTAPRAAAPVPVYDVSTVKPNKTGSGSSGIDVNDATFKADNVSLKMLLQMAYNIKQDLIAGLPGWAESARFDISAKSLADATILNNVPRLERRRMLQQLLQERFNVKTHIEVKMLPVFDMVAMKDGIKFKVFAPNDTADLGGDMGVHGDDHNIVLRGRGVPMADLADALSDQIQRAVIDRTGLQGKYTMEVKWLREDAPAGGDDAAPTIFTALQEQLGLKLVSSKGPVDTLVIDHIDPPTEN